MTTVRFLRHTHIPPSVAINTPRCLWHLYHMYAGMTLVSTTAFHKAKCLRSQLLSQTVSATSIRVLTILGGVPATKKKII